MASNGWTHEVFFRTSPFSLPCDFCIVALHKEGGEATSATPQFGQNTKHLSGPNNPFLSYMHLVVQARISRVCPFPGLKTKNHIINILLLLVILYTIIKS